MHLWRLLELALQLWQRCTVPPRQPVRRVACGQSSLPPMSSLSYGLSRPGTDAFFCRSASACREAGAEREQRQQGSVGGQSACAWQGQQAWLVPPHRTAAQHTPPQPSQCPHPPTHLGGHLLGEQVCVVLVRKGVGLHQEVAHVLPEGGELVELHHAQHRGLHSTAQHRGGG
jgi:hypothetical protein